MSGSDSSRRFIVYILSQALIQQLPLIMSPAAAAQSRTPELPRQNIHRISGRDRTLLYADLPRMPKVAALLILTLALEFIFKDFGMHRVLVVGI